MTTPARAPRSAAAPDYFEGQPERQRRSEEQFEQDGRLRQVLHAWGHGPEFIESLLSWGYTITKGEVPHGRP